MGDILILIYIENMTSRLADQRYTKPLFRDINPLYVVDLCGA